MICQNMMPLLEGIKMADKIKISLTAGHILLGLFSLVVIAGFFSTTVAPSIITQEEPNSANMQQKDQEAGEDSRFSRADLMFMNMMIIHHDQAIEMAELAENRTDNDKVLSLSQNISEAQRYENRKMAEWLNSVGLNRPTRGHRMAGMAAQEEMMQLEQSRGKEFDQLFSELMIEHHRGGIEMARAEVQNGRAEEVIELARGMVQVQQKEVGMMRQWQEEWS